MIQDRDSQVRDRAHAIWLEEGMPEGQAEQHWSRAESEIAVDETSATVAPTNASDETATDDAVTSISEVPEVEEPELAPVAPDVAAITGASAAPAPKAAPSAGKKQTRRKTKPLTPIR